MISKYKEIEINGLKLKLMVRSAFDAIAVSDKFKEIYVNHTENNDETLVLCYTTVLHDALKNNYENLKWYQYFKKRKYKKLLSVKSLLETLSVLDIISYGTEVFKLEGNITDNEIDDSSEAEIKKKPL